MATDLLTYIPLREASERYGVARKSLTQLVDSGRIRAVNINGGIAVAEEDVASTSRRDELWARVGMLDGNPIGVAEARRKYRMGAATLNRWVKTGVVRVLEAPEGRGRGQKRLLNEADVAYAGLVADERGRKRGRRILTPEYMPPHFA